MREMNKVQIILMNDDGSSITGLVDLAKMLDTHLIKRNERIYYFKPSSKIGNYIFEECSQPYTITEF